jgi:hydrogenase-4 component F
MEIAPLRDDQAHSLLSGYGVDSEPVAESLIAWADGSPLALAGVAIHLCAHAVAKALGFYAATPLLAHEPRAAGHAVTGIGRSEPELGASMGIALGTLAGLPPSPIFVSEVLIVAGGFQAGYAWATAAATVLLALGFLGLSHALLETTAGRRRRRRRTAVPGLRLLTGFAAVSVVLLGVLASAVLWLPGSAVVDAMAKGLS